MATDNNGDWIAIRANLIAEDLKRFGPTLPLQISAPSANAQRCSVEALIDTGASHSCISAKLANAIALLPSGSVLQHVAGLESKDVPVYRARIGLPGGTDLDVDLTALAHLTDNHPVLIGRDILSMCRLDVNFVTGRVDLHIKFPPLEAPHER